MKLFGSKNRSKSKKSSRSRVTPASRSRQEYAFDTGYEYESQEEAEWAVKKFKAKKSRRRKMTLGIIVLVLAALFAAYKIWSQPPAASDEGIYSPGSEPSSITGGDDSSGAEPATGSGDSSDLRKDGVYTFLIIGHDDDNGNTDTMMVGMLDTVNHKLNIVSIPRDTLVNVTWPTKKVNTLYSQRGGIDGLKEGLRDILGYTVDCYATIQLDGFIKLIDTIGGVYYDVPFNMNYDDPDQDLHIHISSGYQWLDGEDSLGVVRYRLGNNGGGYTDGDIGRISTQQDFLLAVAKQLLQLGNIPNLATIVDIYNDHVETSLLPRNITFLAEEFLKLDSEDITFLTLPGDYNCGIESSSGINTYAGSYVSVYVDEWLAMINEYINPYKQEITVDNVNILTYVNGVYDSTTGKIAAYG